MVKSKVKMGRNSFSSRRYNRWLPFTRATMLLLSVVLLLVGLSFLGSSWEKETMEGGGSNRRLRGGGGVRHGVVTEKVNKKGMVTNRVDEETDRKDLLLSNLNNLDMPMRRVDGKMKPCLDLLQASEIERLALPPPSPSAIREIRYVTLSTENAQERTNVTGVLAGGGGQPLLLSDLFSGRQTMRERDTSYELGEEGKEVHCGFAAGASAGFEIAPDDVAYMRSCHVVVGTCTFGGGDDMYQPIGMSNATLSKVCYVALWDDVTLEAQTAVGNAPDVATRMVGLWRIVLVRNLPFQDQRLNGKIPKMLSHRLFPSARFYIWVDSKSQFRRDPMGVLEALLWRVGAVLAISEHGARSCIYKEGEAVVHKHKAKPAEVEEQLAQYRLEGLPEMATFDGKKALAEASVIVREHTPLTNLFMCLWFNEVVRYTSRDQLSFGYVLRRLNKLHINMFPVCTRRALVNVIGHKKKAKPLDFGRSDVS